MRIRSLGFFGFLIAVGAAIGFAAPARATDQAFPQSIVGEDLNITISMSKPANGQFFASGEKGVVTVTLQDAKGDVMNPDDFGTLGLYMYGPQAPTKTVSTVKLLGAPIDRAKRPHHYIDLLKDSRAKVSGNVITFPLNAIGDEEPGTYTASLRAIRKGEPLNQVFPLTDFQIKTATVEKPRVVREKCAKCHLGAQNNQFYFHHVDPGHSPVGSPAIESLPVKTCKSCHNNDGYAAYQDPDTKNRVPDPIVFRVHGLHNGINLKNPRNTDHETGLFADYTHVIFPANPKNCDTCHADDAYKQNPSAFACGACHDNVWFGAATQTPKNMVAHKPEIKNNRPCKECHVADDNDTKNVPISASHKVQQPLNKVDVSMSAPKNGKFYEAGEAPVVTMVIKDDSGKSIPDHTKASSDYGRVALMVYGPTRNSKPVLTTIAKDPSAGLKAAAANYTSASGSPMGWDFAAGDTFKIAVNNGPVQELKAPAGHQTPDQVKAWLSSNLKGVKVSATATSVRISSDVAGDASMIAIYNSPVTSKMGWKRGGVPMKRGGMTPGVTAEPYVIVGRSSYQINDLRPGGDPKATRNAGNITYQLDDVKNVGPGTYSVFAWVEPARNKDGTPKNASFSQSALGYMTFQVARAEPDKKVATNCKDCHRDNIWHYDQEGGVVKRGGHPHPEPFDAEFCKACHDYGRYNTGNGFDRVGGTSTNGWSGYGAVPLARRIHGLHFGQYLSHPEEVYAGNPDVFAEAVFPQDVRNCQKCHSDDTTGTWKSEPGRLACMACHDSKSANAHAVLQTLNRTPDEEWSEDRVETCKVCHGVGREFSVEKAHNISDPYTPPYPRSAEEGH